MVGREPLGLLRRHEARRADDRTSRARSFAVDLREPGIADLPDSWRALLLDAEAVRRLEIAVDDARGARRLEAGADLGDEIEHLVEREQATLVEVPAQVVPFEKLHRHERRAIVRLRDLVDVDHVRRAQARRRASLTQ